eukprot:COSAG06_NODE_1966_length_7960_cov_20.489632_3_plen_53_part_00
MTLSNVKFEKSATGPVGSDTQQYSALTLKPMEGRPFVCSDGACTFCVKMFLT